MPASATISVSLIGAGTAQLFGNEGADTIDAAARSAVTIAGGNDSPTATISSPAPAAATSSSVTAAPIRSLARAVPIRWCGGFGGDFVTALAGADLIFANEANDSVVAGDGANTVFGGLGNDTITAGTGRDTIQGNEDNDTIRGGAAIDTISGGSGNDVFACTDAGDDGNNAVGGGPVEQITDVNFDGDRFLVPTAVTFAANMGAGTGGDLNASANNAIAAAYALAGGGANNVAAQFTFGGAHLPGDQPGWCSERLPGYRRPVARRHRRDPYDRRRRLHHLSVGDGRGGVRTAG